MTDGVREKVGVAVFVRVPEEDGVIDTVAVVEAPNDPVTEAVRVTDAVADVVREYVFVTVCVLVTLRVYVGVSLGVTVTVGVPDTTCRLRCEARNNAVMEVC